MKLKEYIIVFSLLANFILAWWIYDLTHNESEVDEELHRSKGRVEVLEKQAENLRLKVKVLGELKDSVNLELQKKPKERVVIKTIYDKKINHIINLPIDSSVGYVAKRLSEIDLD